MHGRAQRVTKGGNGGQECNKNNNTKKMKKKNANKIWKKSKKLRKNACVGGRWELLRGRRRGIEAVRQAIKKKKKKRQKVKMNCKKKSGRKPQNS